MGLKIAKENYEVKIYPQLLNKVFVRESRI